MFLSVLIFILLQLRIGCDCDSKIGFLINDLFRRQTYNERSYQSLLTKDGYPYQHHPTITPDGYKLTLLRIPPHANCTCKNKLPPVFIFHGFTANADTWLVLGKGRALPYILSDACYDVWLPNARGTTHSRGHTKFLLNSSQFWKFSWHEIGIYDNPTNINYILSKTNSSQLHYIGHSQGTTTFFVMTSLMPDYNKKIKTMHALSPVAYMKNSRSPLFTIPARNINSLWKLSNNYGFFEIFSNSQLLAPIQQLYCQTMQLAKNFCYQLVALLSGQNPKQADTNVLFEAVNVYPSGASMYQWIHYAQLVNSGHFESLDFGRRENYKHYGKETPIRYPLEKVSAKMFFHISGNDLIAPYDDIKLLVKRLTIKPTYHVVSDKKWSHFDYVIGKEAKEQVYDQVLADIKKSDNYQCSKFV